MTTLFWLLCEREIFQAQRQMNRFDYWLLVQTNLVSEAAEYFLLQEIKVSREIFKLSTTL